MLGEAVQVNALEVYEVGAEPLPAVTVSDAWVQPVVEIAGKAAEAGPDAASVTAAVKVVEPATSPL